MHISQQRGVRGILEDVKEDVGHARVLLAIGTPDKAEAADRILLAVQHRLRFLLEPGITPEEGSEE